MRDRARGGVLAMFSPYTGTEGEGEEGACGDGGDRPMTRSKRRTTRLSGKDKRRVMRALVRRDGTDCHWCHKPMEEDITMDHLLPMAIGGSDRIDNIVLAHGECNNKRANPPLGRRRTKADGVVISLPLESEPRA